MVHIHADKMDQIQTHFQVNLNKRATRYLRIDVTAAAAAAALPVANHKLTDTKHSIHRNRSWHINSILAIMWWWFFFKPASSHSFRIHSVFALFNLWRPSHLIALLYLHTPNAAPNEIVILFARTVCTYTRTKCGDQRFPFDFSFSLFVTYTRTTKHIIICMYLDRYMSACVCSMNTVWVYRINRARK